MFFITVLRDWVTTSEAMVGELIALIVGEMDEI